MTIRAAVHASVDEVAAWAEGRPGRCRATDAGGGWSVCDLDGPSAEDLALALARDVYVEDFEEVWRVLPSGTAKELPMWVDDPSDDVEVATFEAVWAPVPDLLLGSDPRLEPPHAWQALILPTPDGFDLRAAVTGFGLPVTVVSLDGWTVIDTAAESLVSVAAGLTTRRGRWALVLSTDGQLASLRVVVRGRVSGEHVWNRATTVSGRDAAAGSGWHGTEPEPVDVARLTALLPPPNQPDTEVRVRSVLEREGRPAAVLTELLHALGLQGEASVVTDALVGKGLRDHPQAVTIQPPESFAQFLRVEALGADLDPDDIPWFSILCSVIFFPLLVSLCFHTYQLVTGSLDGWGWFHLATAVINTPAAFVYLRRVLRWRALRRG